MTARPRFLIAAAHKSSGKTVISAGIAAALSATSDDVGTFKKGPDYIDPMWLSAATGRPCYNLDFNAMERHEIVAFFAARSATSGISLVEANKGLFDGVNPDGSDANSELAKLLGLPVVLVIDTMGMTRGIAPLLMGYRMFDPEVKVAGVILNKVGGSRHEGKLRKAVETYTDLPVIGAVGRDHSLEIGERHLGLTTPAESTHVETLLARFRDAVEQGVEMETLRKIARGAPPLPATKPGNQDAVPQPGTGLKIGIARDAAFGFYYPDDLEAFATAGATLVPMDMMRDTVLPPLDGLFIGGGFPEMHLPALSENTAMRRALLEALRGGMPCYAECGGLMYLCESISFQGQTAPMVGLVPGRAVMHDRPQGRGYVEFSARADHPWGARVTQRRAHEFHYASIDGLPAATRYARDMRRGHGVDGRHDGIVIGNTLAGFCHMRNTATCPWVRQFLEFVAGKKEKAPPGRRGL